MKKRVAAEYNGKNYTFLLTLSENSDSESLIEQSVALENCDSPSVEEEKIIQEKTCLFSFRREWLKGVEAKSYISLCHSRLEEAVKKFPGNYLANALPISHDKRF